MTDHDPLCMSVEAWAENGEDPADCPECALIAKVRADEREQYQGRRDDMMRALSEELLNVRTKTLADLRAKVEALHAEALGWQKTREEKGYRESAQLFAVEAEAYADVIDLIDGSSDEAT